MTLEGKEKLLPLLEFIAKLQAELGKLGGAPSLVKVNREKLSRWEQRTCELFGEMNLADEAKRLQKASGAMVMGDPFGNLIRHVEAKRAVLVALSDDVETHPDYWIKKISKQDAGISKETPIVAVSSVSAKTIFLGHGHNPVWAIVQSHLKDELNLDVEAWESKPRTGFGNIEVLKKILDQSGFAVIIVTGDDIYEDGSHRPRQNVVHEIGLFQGRLGFEKVALFVQEGVEGFTNLDGYQVVRFNGSNIQASFYELDRTLRREGF